MQYYTDHIKITENDNYEFGKLEYDVENNNFMVNGKIVRNNRGITNDIVYINNNDVIGIKERGNRYFVGILYINSKTKYGMINGKNKYLFKPLNKKYPSFFVASKYKNDENQFVKIEFKEWNKSERMPSGSPMEYIGYVGNLDAEIEALRYYYDLYLPTMKVDKKRVIDNKINDDITSYDYKVFSIDPAGSLDIDDAFSFENVSENIYEIGVHIASPATYFGNDIETIKDILYRVSTVYLPNKKYPMLPELYSDNLFSLLENKKRDALSVIYKFDNQFKLLSFEIKPTKVYSIKNYTYDEFDDELADNFMRISNSIFNGEITDSHILVEKWMVLTNNKIAESLINQNKRNIILRVQEKSSKPEVTTNISNNELIKYLNNHREESAIYKLYSPEDGESYSHYRLGLDYYTHFTSPIRRAVDFYIHTLCLENAVKYEISLIELERINKFTKNHRKFQRQVKRLEFLANIKESEVEIVTSAYVIDIKERYITLYIPEYSLEERIYILNNESNMRELYEKVNVILYVFLTFDNIFDKLKLKIV